MVLGVRFTEDKRFINFVDNENNIIAIATNVDGDFNYAMIPENNRYEDVEETIQWLYDCEFLCSYTIDDVRGLFEFSIKQKLIDAFEKLFRIDISVR